MQCAATMDGGIIMNGNILLQIDTNASGVIAANTPVVFQNIVYSNGDISYTLGSDTVVFNRLGRYLVEWWAATQTVVGAQEATFGVSGTNLSSSASILGSSPIRMGEVVGFAIVEVIDVPATLTLSNQSGQDIWFSTSVPTTVVLRIHSHHELENLDDGNAPGSLIGIGAARGYTMGNNAVALGLETTASGDYSFAQRYVTQALGIGSYAQGGETRAEGIYAHAEGYQTLATADFSHAEGANTQALGTSAHAEGNNTQATGFYSHSEGSNSVASGNSSHAEGDACEASGAMAHAEGFQTLASEWATHAEGNNTQATGNSAHAEGYFTELRRTIPTRRASLHRLVCIRVPISWGAMAMPIWIIRGSLPTGRMKATEGWLRKYRRTATHTLMWRGMLAGRIMPSCLKQQMEKRFRRGISSPLMWVKKFG